MTITAYLVSLDLIFIPLILIATALGVAWLANLSQPTPDGRAWAKAEGTSAHYDIEQATREDS